MEQTEYTTWEVVKMLRMLPYEELNSRFVQTLVKVIASVPIKELKECEVQRCGWDGSHSYTITFLIEPRR